MNCIIILYSFGLQDVILSHKFVITNYYFLPKYRFETDCDVTGHWQVLINKEYLQMEPIGLVFVFFFALILLIQFIAMLFHRFVTLSHILSSCELTSCCNTEVSALTPSWLFVRMFGAIVGMVASRGIRKNDGWNA